MSGHNSAKILAVLTGTLVPACALLFDGFFEHGDSVVAVGLAVLRRARVETALRADSFCILFDRADQCREDWLPRQTSDRSRRSCRVVAVPAREHCQRPMPIRSRSSKERTPGPWMEACAPGALQAEHIVVVFIGARAAARACVCGKLIGPNVARVSTEAPVNSANSMAC